MKLCTAKYEIYMQRLFYRLGVSIGTHPWRYIFGVLLFTFVCAIGLVRFHQISNARQTFTASDSASHKEGNMMKEFLGQNGTLHMIEMMIKAADNGNLLREAHLHQFIDLTKEIRNITVEDENGKKHKYDDDLCHPYCAKNDALFLFLDLYDSNHTNTRSDGALELSYPTMELLDRRVFLAASIYGPSFVNGTNIIDGFTTAILRFYMTYSDPKLLIKWEDKLVELLYDSHKYPLLTAGAGSDNLVAKEVKAIGTKTAPLLGMSLGLLMVFLFFCSFRYKMRESKPFEAMLGGCIPILASIATIGLVSATGLAFQSIIVSTLFLILAIGIDDVFLMLSEWHRSEKSLPIPERAGEMAKIAFCSMTVTSVWRFISIAVEKWWFRMSVIGILIGYWALGIYGIENFKTDLSIQKMGDPDSRIVVFKTEYDHVIRAMQTVAILVRKPGDLRNPRHLRKVKDMVTVYETADYSYGPDSTFCWLQPYLDHLAFFEAEDDIELPPFTYRDLPVFLASNSIYNSTLHINESACLQDKPECLTAFMFTTGFSGKADYYEMYPLIESWRAIASRFPELEIYTYTERHNFADQSNDMQSIIWQTAMSEVICMGLSFIIFVPDPVSISAAMFSLLSVNMGVLGFLSLWDVGMDPVSMASLLMSIGFSVDISAHITYHYYEVKASTVILVTVFGLIHGLIILPVFLSIFTQIYKLIFKKGSTSSNGSIGKGSTNSSSGSNISIGQPAAITSNNNNNNNDSHKY
ncbi:hypothetical protein WR25_03367 [Diploscapter pachys]|uniref:SSD domain-containing protein n=1 Tax=Diploscapter pachys TaxID=2018661 RepID=A0A2A2LL85_9BILA|nr:hypothetical protein WR25_03367 [Diploscapter pachys]